MRALTMLKKIERSIPKDPTLPFMVRDVYLAKSNNGEHNVVLKPMDVCRVYGECSRADVTVFGLLLRWLTLQGYLVEVRPRKYRPTEKFIKWVKVCTWPNLKCSSCKIDPCIAIKFFEVIEIRKGVRNDR